MDIHHFTKLPLLGFFIKKSPKPIKTWKLFFFQKRNKTNNKISGRLGQLWQSSRSGQGRQACYWLNSKLLIFSKLSQLEGEGCLGETSNIKRSIS